MPKGIYQRTQEYRDGKLGEGNPKWKGNKVGYDALHAWVARRLGKPERCELCGCDKKPQNKKQWFDWANISGKYLRELSDWIRLCRLCHYKLDRR